MASKGQSIENKITGEKITWLETAKESKGKVLRFDFCVRPKGVLPVRHLHPNRKKSLT